MLTFQSKPQAHSYITLQTINFANNNPLFPLFHTHRELHIDENKKFNNISFFKDSMLHTPNIKFQPKKEGFKKKENRTVNNNLFSYWKMVLNCIIALN